MLAANDGSILPLKILKIVIGMGKWKHLYPKSILAKAKAEETILQIKQQQYNIMFNFSESTKKGKNLTLANNFFPDQLVIKIWLEWTLVFVIIGKLELTPCFWRWAGIAFIVTRLSTVHIG